MLGLVLDRLCLLSCDEAGVDWYKGYKRAKTGRSVFHGYKLPRQFMGADAPHRVILQKWEPFCLVPDVQDICSLMAEAGTKYKE